MQILPDSKLSLEPGSDGNGGKHPRSEVLYEGRGTGISIPGVTLECAVGWNKSYVLFTTDDIPQEDTLHICLLAENLELLDYVNVGAMYSTGSLSGIQLEEPDKIHFRFIGGVTWTVRLSSTPAFHLPLLADPKGVSRPLRLSTHLQLMAKPRPQDT
jgi:hypothetical protein